MPDDAGWHSIALLAIISVSSFFGVVAFGTEFREGPDELALGFRFKPLKILSSETPPFNPTPADVVLPFDFFIKYAAVPKAPIKSRVVQSPDLDADVVPIPIPAPAPTEE